jgi:hypothetical protein
MCRIFATHLVLAFRLGLAFKILLGTVFGQIKSPGFRRPRSLRDYNLLPTSLIQVNPRLIQSAGGLTHPKVELIHLKDD